MNYIYGSKKKYSPFMSFSVNRSFDLDAVKYHSSSNNATIGLGKATLMPIKFNRALNSTNIPSIVSKKKEICLNYCNLTNIDPWDSTHIKFFQPQKDHMLNCSPQMFQHSKLIYGQLFIYSNKSLSDRINCQMRCLFSKGDRKLKFAKWIKVINGTKPECDVIEVECRLIEGSEKEVVPFYNYLHAQIYRNISKFPPPLLPSKPLEKYDAHVIVFDSVSYTQFVRSMPKTLDLLRDHYDAVQFEHLNKIGSNSYFNGFAFLIGKTIGNIPKSPFSRGRVGDYSDQNIVCNTSFDDEQFIGSRYKDDGYITMMAEDWEHGVFNWPDCKGFLKTPMDHYNRPFYLRIEKLGDKPESLAKTVLQDSCREHHYNIMENLKNFLKAYPDKPKFSISWMIHLAHDDQNALSSSDNYFYNFFNDTKKDFENSFLFIMGDHGLRYGKIRDTKIGEMEDNNPALFLSVPKPLRDNATFMNQLKVNSKELITHYDIYATLTGIAQPKNPRISNPVLYGSSLFNPLPYPRTCDSLHIPLEYCNCHSRRTLLLENNTIGISAAKLMVERINFDLSTSDQTLKLCSKLLLNEAAEIIVEDYGGEQAVRAYRITFSTLPGNGKFVGVISYDPSNQNFEILSSKFSRLNAYGPQAKCARKSFFASYCYCIN